MLNRTSAAPTAGSDPASAMVNTEMAMPTQTERTKSLTPGFAQVLESSIETAGEATGHTGNSHASKFAVPAKPRGGVSSDTASNGVNWILTPSLPPTVTVQPETIYSLSAPAIATPVPANGGGSGTQSETTNPTSFATLSPSTQETFGNQIPDLPAGGQLAPSLSASTAPMTTAFTSQISILQENVSLTLGGTTPPATVADIPQSAQSSTGSQVTEPDVLPAPDPSTQSAAMDSASLAAAPSAPSPLGEQMPSIQQYWTGQAASAYANEIAASGIGSPQSNVSEAGLSAPVATISPLQTTQSTVTTSAAAPLPAPGATHAKQQTPVLTQAAGSATTAHSSTTNSQPDASLTNSRGTTAAPALGDLTVSAQAVPPAISAQDPSDSAATAQGPGDPTALPQTIPTAASVQDPSDSTAPAQDVPLASPAQESAYTATTSTAPIVVNSGIGAAPSVAATVQEMWTRKGAQATVTGFSFASAGGSKIIGQRSASPASGAATPPSQTAQGSVASSAADPSARQQKFSAANLAGKIKIAAPVAVPAAAPLPATAPSAPATGSSKVQVAATPNSSTTFLPSDDIWPTPTTLEDAPTLTSIKAGAANLGNDDSATANSVNKTMPDSSGTFDQSANPETDDDSRPANSQVSAPAATSELFAPVTLASNFSLSTQTVSVATALKQDPSSLATSSTSSNHGDVAGDTTGGAQLPSAVVVHRAAEAAELSAGLQAWNGGDNAQSRMVQSARLAGNLGESEMNVSLRADALGAVELRTHVSGDLVGASISVDRHDAHAMLSNDLGSLHQALNDRQLRVGDVKIFQGSFGSDATADDGHSSQRREMAPQQQQAMNWTSGSSSTPASVAATTDGSEGSMFFDSNGRLSVRA